jgi:hypothetical protein
VAKKCWYTAIAYKDGGYVSQMGYFVCSGKEAKRLHAESHPDWDIGKVRRSTNEELEFNVHGHEMTEMFHGR